MLYFGSFLAAIAAIALHETIGNFIFSLGASWTISKLFPYILCIFFGLICCIALFRFFKNRTASWVFGILTIAAIFGADFALNPIYSGDFSNQYKSIKTKNETIKSARLTVIAIPGCPFCHGSINTLKTLKERNPNLTIQFLVASSDSTTIEPYQKQIDQAFKLSNITDFKEIERLKIQSFPTFILTKKDQKQYLWTNDTFGTRARDMVEKSVK